MSVLVPRERIEQTILLIRGHRVMLDADLAELYGVETKAFNRAGTRNMERFPDDLMFRLTKKEYEDLRYHFGTSRWGGRRYLPYVFTEQGVAMLSSVLRSKRAIQVNIAIMRAFVQLRELIASNKGLARRLNELEKMYVRRKRCQEPFPIDHTRHHRPRNRRQPPSRPRKIPADCDDLGSDTSEKVT